MRGTQTNPHFIEGDMFTAVAGSTTNLEICRNFTPVSSGVPRFKVDPDGGWGGDEFPASDTPANGWTKIVINKNTKTIVSITKNMAVDCGMTSSSSSKSSNSSAVSSSTSSASDMSLSSSSKSISSGSSSSSKSASSSSVAAVAHDFRTRTAYYVMLDRFENGDKTNDAGVSTAPAVDPVEWKKYWGGDIDGLISKLDYLKSLGVNAVVVSSLVDNSALGYHGFWGRDFYAVDEHLAKDLAKVKELDKAMEDRGMKLVMEITLNNSTNETGEAGKLWKAADPVIDSFTNGVTAGWYHNNGSIGVDGCSTKALCDAEWFDPAKYLTKSVSGRPDFAQGTDGKNSIADEYLIGAAKLWMDNGIDGFRIHSAKFIEPGFVERFSAAVREKDASAYVFGDWSETAGDIPLANTFVKEGHGAELTDIDLRNHLESAIAGDETMKALSTHLVTRQTNLGNKANVQAIYMDSYAESRTSVLLRAKTTEKTSRGVAGKAMTQAKADARQNMGIAMVMTLPGVPVIYYGTEANIATLTANASGEMGGDPFNREKIDFAAAKKPAFSMIKALSDLRSTSKAIQEGGYEQRWVDDDVLVYQRESADGDCAVVAINRGAAMTSSIHVKRLCLKADSYTNLLNSTDAAISVVRNPETPELEGEADLTLKENQVIVLH